MKHSENWVISSGLMCRSTTSKPRARPSSITVCRVRPFRKQSASGVMITPSCTKKMLAPVASAT